MDDNAQVNMLEAVLVVAMLFMTLYFSQSLSSTVYESAIEKNILKIKGASALESLDNYPNDDYHSLLTWYIIENMTESFTKFIYTSGRIFPCIAYNVYLYNISMMFRNSTAKENNYKTLWSYIPAPEIGKRAQTYRIITYDGYVYEIVLDMWYI